MKNKLIIIVVGILALLILLGISFAIYSVNSEASIDLEKVSSEKSILIQNDNFGNLSDSKSSQNKKSVANGRSFKNSKLNEKVVDQTLCSAKTDDSNSEGESSELEIIFYDGDQNTLLTNYQLEIEFNFQNETPRRDFYTTDKEGKVRINTIKKGNMALSIFTKDYPISQETVSILFKRHTQAITLYRGGTIEIKATDQENKIINNLQVIFLPKFSLNLDFKSIDLPANLIDSRNIYQVSNITLGSHELFFKAKGYLESPIYKINIEPNKATYIEIKLLKPRVIYLDLNIEEKPKSIQVMKSKVRPEYYLYSNVHSSMLSLMDVKPFEGNKIYLNQKSLYEIALEERVVPFISIYVDTFVPQTIEINNHQDFYKISLDSALETTIKIIDSNKNAVVGAYVSCSSDFFYQNEYSDKDGYVKLIGLKKDMILNLKVSHENYVALNENWKFKGRDNLTKNFVLKDGNEINGIVTADGKGVAGADVFLYVYKFKDDLKAHTKTDGKGYYSFSHLFEEGYADYWIKVFHRKLGVAYKSRFYLADPISVFNFNLINEKSLSFKLVNNNGDSMPNQKFILKCVDANLEKYIGTTNEQGECNIFNLFPGKYLISLEGSEQTLNENNINVPSTNLILVCKPIDYTIINIKIPNNLDYLGLLTDISYSNFEISKINPSKKENGKYSLSKTNNHYDIGKRYEDDISNFQGIIGCSFGLEIFDIFLEAPGYSAIKVGPFKNFESIPKEIIINLNKGYDLRITVIDSQENKKIENETVEVYFNYYKLRGLPTNENGEVVFNHLIGKNTITINSEKYIPFQTEIDISETKDLLIKLTKVGHIKGQIVIPDEIEVISIELISDESQNKILYGKKPINTGEVEFNRLIPGDYSIKIKYKHLDAHKEFLINKILVESNKTTEINLSPIIEK